MPFRIEAPCNGCTACASQCPTAAIAGARDGLHVIDPRLCIECGVCGLICPVEAVLDAQGARAVRLPRSQRPRPVVELEACNGCGLCVDFCPFDCLCIVGPLHRGVALLARPLACVSCAECVRACPKDAVAMAPLDLRKLDPAVARARIGEVLRAR